MRSSKTVAAMAIVLAGAWLFGAADASGAEPLVEARGLNKPRMKGNWLVFHVGREGQQVWDLTKGEKVAEIKQYRPLPYDVSDRYVLSVSGAGTFYRFDLSEMDRLTRPMRRIDDLEDIRLGQGGGWFVGVIERYNRERREKQRHLRVFSLGGRSMGRPLTTALIEERFDVSERLVTWVDQQIGGAGLYVASIGERDPERISDEIPTAGPWTDGRRVVWVRDGQVKVYDSEAEGEKTTTPLEDVEAPDPLMARLAGDRLVVLNADWAIVSYPLAGGEGTVIVDPAERGGMKELVGVGADRVVWRTGDMLWSTPLEPDSASDAGPGSDAASGEDG